MKPKNKPILISFENHERLNKLKHELYLNSINATINYLLKLQEKEK